MIGTISRWLLAIGMCVAVLGLTLPARAIAKPASEDTMSCCGKMGEQQQGHHCKHDAPPSSDDDHCCAACAIGLSLFVTPPARFIFSQRTGERFAIAAIAEASRFERPPVPPPRTILG